MHVLALKGLLSNTQELAELLIQRGINLTIKNKNGETALELARKANPPLAEFLEKILQN